MRLGRLLLGNLGRKKRDRHKKPGVLQTVGAVAAIAVVIKALFDKYGDRLTAPSIEEPEPKLNYDPPVRSGKKVELDPPTLKRTMKDDDFIMGELGKLALCWYIAGIDDDISPEEKSELNKLSGDIQNDEAIPAHYKTMITKEILVPGIQFSTVTKYLDHADPVELIDLDDDIKELAGINGISEREQYAIDVFEDYVEKKTGHLFHKGQVHQVDLVCPNCGAALTESGDRSKVICEYCGFSKMILRSQKED